MISVIIPFYNEADSLLALYKELSQELEKTGKEYEIVFVDDGSEDNSRSIIEHIQHEKAHKGHIGLVSHTRKMGKGAALLSGIHQSRGDIIVFMDADLQNDPHDIHNFLQKIDEGYDFVNGVREDRRDSRIIKLYSALGNVFLKKYLKSPFTDINCGYKVMKRNVLNEIVLYSNNFRFLPVAVYLKGFRVTEIMVKHHKRIHGVSKFGASKIFIGVFDMLTAYFIYRFAERPLHFFGPIGAIVFFSGFLLSLYLAMERIVYGVLLFKRPVLLLGILLLIIGIQIIMTGIIGELIVYVNKKNTK